jgi:hypothetical protein
MLAHNLGQPCTIFVIKRGPQRVTESSTERRAPLSEGAATHQREPRRLLLLDEGDEAPRVINFRSARGAKCR